MDAYSALIPLATIWLTSHLAVGPDFLVTARTAISQSRRAAMQTVAGICAGTVIWAVAGYYGINILFSLVPWLYGALKLCGGAYLIYLGLQLLRGSFTAQEADNSVMSQMPAKSAFRLGCLTNLANPKAALFTTSLFAATLPPEPTVLFGPAAIAIMTAISFCFYGFLACTLTTRSVAGVFIRAGRWVDRFASIIFMGIGTRLVLRD